MTKTKAVFLTAAICAFLCLPVVAQAATALVQLGQNTGQVQIAYLDIPNTYTQSVTQLAATYGSDGRLSGFEQITSFPEAGAAFHEVVTFLQYDPYGAASFYKANVNGTSLAFDLQAVNSPQYVPNQLTDPSGIPYPPVAVAATTTNSSGFTANWFGSGAASGYRLDVSTNNTFSTYLPGFQNRDAGDSRSLAIAGLTPNTVYVYRLRATNAFGASGNSATMYVMTPPAVTPADTNAFYFGPPAAPVWDISGLYQITNHLQGARLQPRDVVFKDIGMSVDGHGKIEGAGTILVLIGSDIVGGDYKVNGKMSGGGEKTRANFSIKFKGDGTVAGVVTKATINAKYNLQIVPAGPAMAGKTSGNANFSHLGGGTIKGDIVIPLPPGADGGWNVTLDLLPLGNKISGTAVILVDNIPSTALATKVKGNVPKSGTAKITLTGTGNSSGTKLTMQVSPLLEAGAQTPQISGTILGQKVKN